MSLLGGYDDWKATDYGGAGRSHAAPPAGCPVCDGTRHGVPCSQDCLLVVLRAETRRRMGGLLLAARRCLAVGRRYVAEGDDATSPRLAAVLWRVFELRDQLAGDRAQLALYRQGDS